MISVAINQTVLQGQGVGQQVGGVSAATQLQVQQQVAYQAEHRQQTNGGGGGGGGFGAPRQASMNWEPFAWLLMGLM